MDCLETYHGQNPAAGHLKETKHGTKTKRRRVIAGNGINAKWSKGFFSKNPELKRADAPEEFNLTSGELCLLLFLPLSSGDAPRLGLNGALVGGVLPLRPAC